MLVLRERLGCYDARNIELFNHTKFNIRDNSKIKL